MTLAIPDLARGRSRAAWTPRRAAFGGHLGNAVATARRRLMVIAAFFAIAFAAVAGRLIDVTLMVTGMSAIAGGLPVAVDPLDRADIVDRNGLVLATSLPMPSLYADPAMVHDPAETARRLAEVLPDFDVAHATEQLAGERRFVWLRRGLTPAEQQAIHELGLPGVHFQSEARRFYPLGNLTAHTVGFTDIDSHGLAGVERSFNDRLAAGGDALRLSIDIRVQQIVQEELGSAIDEFSAIGGVGMVMDVTTGEMLSLVSLPDFDPYQAGNMPDEARFNRATLGVYEMGSTFKVFTTAMALDSGATSITSGYDARHPIRVGRFTINDFHGENRWLSVPEILLYSSNIGAVQMALAVGTQGQQEYMGAFGLTSSSPLELPEVGAPMVPSPWREINTMTIAFGHGLAVSSAQLVSAVGASINGGVLYPATILAREEGAVEGTRVISEDTSAMMRRLLRLVVTDGTGKNASAEGYVVGGKTGTAEKQRGRGYSENSRLSSFVAAFPMTDPEYVIFIMLDEPHGTRQTYGYATGGWVAAPAVRRIVTRMAPMLGLAPVEEETQEILDAMYVPLPGRGRVTVARDQ